MTETKWPPNLPLPGVAFSITLPERLVRIGCQNDAENCPLARCLLEHFPGLLMVNVGAETATLWYADPEDEKRGWVVEYDHNGYGFVTKFDLSRRDTIEHYTPETFTFSPTSRHPILPQRMYWLHDDASYYKRQWRDWIMSLRESHVPEAEQEVV